MVDQIHAQEINFKRAPSKTPFESENLDKLLTKVIETVQDETPVYIYFQSELEKSVGLLRQGFGNDTNIRFAMKSCSNVSILKTFERLGLHFDCSSIYEVERVLRAGINPTRIELVTQEITPKSLAYLEKLEGHDKIKIVASSKYQLESLAHSKFRSQVEGIRINPGQGSGASKKTIVSGPEYSFGIWFEQIDEILELSESLGIKIKKLHSHIGAGTDPKNWLHIADVQLGFIKDKFKDVEVLNIGGGFKIARTEKDLETNIELLGQYTVNKINEFNQQNQRNLKLEIEPGTFLVANSGILLCEIVDMVSTKNQSHEEPGFQFVKVNSGLNDITRPSLYGAQHQIKIVKLGQDQSSQKDLPVVQCVVVGHCCESGDLLSCKSGEGETPEEIPLLLPSIGDKLVIKGTGAYCSSMSLKNYNSFPEIAEVLVVGDIDIEDFESVQIKVIRKRQDTRDITKNEIDIYP
eukprot:403362902